jgi:hypothetical protein
MKKVPEQPYIDPYRAEDDARTLQRAGEVMGDGKRMAAAQKHLQKTQAAVQRVLQAPKPAAKSASKGKR